MDDLDLSRYRQEDRDRVGPFRSAARNRVMLGRVTTAAPAVGKFMKVMPRGVLGAETEGGAGSASDLGTTQTPVYLVGPGVPATNDEVVARFVDYRWVAHRRAASGGPCAASPISVCPKYEGCGGHDLSGATFTLIDSTGATIGTSTSNSSGVGGCIPSPVKLLSGSKVRLTGFPCIYTAPADQPVSGSTCGATLNVDFGTLTFDAHVRDCCCKDRCTDLPASVNVLINGHSVTCTRITAKLWQGCFILPAVNSVSAYSAAFGCHQLGPVAADVPVYVSVGGPGGSTCANAIGISIPFDMSSKLLLTGDCTGTATSPSQPYDAGPGYPACFGASPTQYQWINYGLTGLSASCSPVFCASSGTVGTAPGGFVPGIGTVPNGDAFYQAFGTVTLTGSYSE